MLVGVLIGRRASRSTSDEGWSSFSLHLKRVGGKEFLVGQTRRSQLESLREMNLVFEYHEDEK